MCSVGGKKRQTVSADLEQVMSQLCHDVVNYNKHTELVSAYFSIAHYFFVFYVCCMQEAHAHNLFDRCASMTCPLVSIGLGMLCHIIW